MQLFSSKNAYLSTQIILRLKLEKNSLKLVFMFFFAAVQKLISYCFHIRKLDDEQLFQALLV